MYKQGDLKLPDPLRCRLLFPSVSLAWVDEARYGYVGGWVPGTFALEGQRLPRLRLPSRVCLQPVSAQDPAIEEPLRRPTDVEVVPQNSPFGQLLHGDVIGQMPLLNQIIGTSNMQCLILDFQKRLLYASLGRCDFKMGKERFTCTVLLK